MRETRVKWYFPLQIFDLLGGEGDGKCLDIIVKMFDLTATDKGENMGYLMHHIGNRD